MVKIVPVVLLVTMILSTVVCKMGPSPEPPMEQPTESDSCVEDDNFCNAEMDGDTCNCPSLNCCMKEGSVASCDYDSCSCSCVQDDCKDDDNFCNAEFDGGICDCPSQNCCMLEGSTAVCDDEYCSCECQINDN